MAVAVGLSALGCGVGAEAILTELEVLQTLSRGAVGFECELQLLLGLEHFWNRLMGSSSRCFI